MPPDILKKKSPQSTFEVSGRPSEMVGLPNRAARCGICQHHKIKCDLLRPACSRCKRLRLVCDYPGLQHGQIFVNRNMRNPRAKAVDIISTTTTEKKHKPAESPCSKQTMIALEMHHRNQNNSMPTPLNSGAVDRMQLLSSIFDLHFPKARGPTIPGQGPASWINSLHGITATNSAYDLSLKALCLAQAGSWHHDTALVKDSHRLYGSALRGLREALSHRKLEAPEATLAIIIILSTYELFSGSSDMGQGWVSHAQGGSQILRLLDPAVLLSPVGRIICPRIRTIGIFESFRSRKSSVLTGMHFEVAPGMGNVDIFRRLQDLMIQIPPLLETFDTLAIADINKKAEETVLTRILHRCSSLHAQLLAWYEVLSEQIPGQLYSSSPSKAHSPADLFGTRIFPLAFEFPSLNIAQLLLLYWSTLIVLYRTMQDIDKREQKTRNETDDAEHPPRLLLQYSASDSDPTFTQHFNPSCPSTNHVALLAKKICQSFEYCYKSTNSTISVQYTVFPRWVVQEFYASRPEYDRQLAWCEEVHNMTAPGSRFDLGFTKFGNLNEV